MIQSMKSMANAVLSVDRGRVWSLNVHSLFLYISRPGPSLAAWRPGVQTEYSSMIPLYSCLGIDNRELYGPGVVRQTVLCAMTCRLERLATE